MAPSYNVMMMQNVKNNINQDMEVLQFFLLSL
ncbi:hypothetical protein T4B_9041 [Trichinella pseudospiralis]|uniref:Uncharacterized protein n=1 Tax=Trichinella pseudospiralis TaxID=6337 RepID=A0A0V1GGP6_TRIPS|nr:hypothetical protein T4B_9041 [Trichinella pseudospiralis]